MALVFDRGEMFGHDKVAGTPCHNLTGTLCGIHDQLDQTGYRGCVAFDCLGAGQRVTALFDGSWRETPALTGPMTEAFRQMRTAQELHQMLEAASALPLPEDKRAELEAWRKRLCAAKSDLDRLTGFDGTDLRRWFRSLSTIMSRPAE